MIIFLIFLIIIKKISKFTKEEKKGIKTIGGSNEEKFDLFDFGLYSQNIKEMNDKLKDIINKKEIDSFVACNLSS